MDRSTSRPCAECNKPLKRHGKGDFCQPACRSAFHNRRTKRGALVLDVLLLTRRHPKDTTDWPARLEALLDKFEAEDAAAGRKRGSRTLFDVRYDPDFPHVDL